MDVALADMTEMNGTSDTQTSPPPPPTVQKYHKSSRQKRVKKLPFTMVMVCYLLSQNGKYTDITAWINTVFFFKFHYYVILPYKVKRTRKI